MQRSTIVITILLFFALQDVYLSVGNEHYVATYIYLLCMADLVFDNEHLTVSSFPCMHTPISVVV